MKRQLGFSVIGLLVLALAVPADASGKHRHRGGHHGYHSRGHFSIGFGYPSFYYGSYYHRPYRYGFYGSRYYRPYSYRPYYYRSYYGPHRPYPVAGEHALGGIDLNVKPKKTQVYIDGDFAGLVRSYDGYPGYLWLPKGEYKLILYHPGYETLEHDITVHPGIVIDFKTQMLPGESIPPKELAAPAGGSEPEGKPVRARPKLDVRPNSGVAEVEIRETPGLPGRLHLDVAPADASVYLDGRFLGRGAELADMETGLVIEPGDHLLEVVRPGREPESRTFRTGSGEVVELQVELAHEKG